MGLGFPETSLVNPLYNTSPKKHLKSRSKLNHQVAEAISNSAEYLMFKD
jgi:hypothetical protein